LAASIISIPVTSVSPINTARLPSAGCNARLRDNSFFSFDVTEVLLSKAARIVRSSALDAVETQTRTQIANKLETGRRINFLEVEPY
jgi:hypothetical protein